MGKADGALSLAQAAIARRLPASAWRLMCDLPCRGDPGRWRGGHRSARARRHADAFELGEDLLQADALERLRELLGQLDTDVPDQIQVVGDCRLDALIEALFRPRDDLDREALFQ